MDRATTWRARIDNPTNWAILTCGTAVSFVLNDPDHSHAVLLLLMLQVLMFLAIEARRTRYYDLWSSWLRLLEIEYLAPILQDNVITAADTWQELLVQDLGYPHFKVSFWRMFRRRLRDHYLAIYLFLLLAWLVKLVQHPVPACSGPNDTITCHAAVGPLPGEYVLGGVLAYYALLILLTVVGYSSRDQSIEILSRDRTLDKLVSPFQHPVGRRSSYAEPAVAGEYEPDVTTNDD
jgi:uncharacterized membrane protein